MNLKNILYCVIAYACVATFFAGMHLAISRNGMGNEFMIFGLPLIGIVMSLLASAPNEFSRTDIVGIIAGCLIVSFASFPIHQLAPSRLLNPYSGPTGVLLVVPILAAYILVFNRFIKPRLTSSNDKDAV